MSNQTSVSEDDWITLLIILVLAFATGIVSVGMFLDPLRAWLLQYHVLEQGDAMVVPLFEGVGFGWGQLIVIAAIMLCSIALIVWLKRRAAARV
ncbi:hypothetical protein [Microbacterium lacticum]|uniref:hypothetical protein n=1 Tax=Microbacterium lacticum TaxID=33885 RepID=UPI001F58D3CC|nr:hypothetical protein [Microbacterium lacticum]